MSRSVHPAGPRHADVLAEAHAASRPDDVNALDPVIWPSSAQRDGGVIAVGGVPATDVAAKFGTPAFVLDEADLRDRARAYASASEHVSAYYAGKAFLCTAVARWVADEGLGLDVCTGGELAVALAAGFPVERIGMHGNNKSLDELRAAVAARVGHVVVDSFEEIERLAGAAAEAGVRQRVLVRVTVGVEAHTHEFIATAHEDQKFGFSLRDGAASDAVARVLAHDSLDFGGLHSHIGSQIFDTAGFEVAAHRLVGLAAQVRAEHGVDVAELNLGGGLGIAYVTGDDPETPKQIIERLVAIVSAESRSSGLPMPRLAVEPGRAVVGPSAITLYTVGTVKEVALDGGVSRRYVSVDGGMSDNIRTALYGAEYTCALANRASSAEPVLCRVVGKHCESGDIVVRDAWLPGDLAPGDLIAVAATGAYCRSMASNYNYVPRPPVVAVAGGGAHIIVRRETEDDLLRLDAGIE